jgi:type IV pilus assembly protein PilW
MKQHGVVRAGRRARAQGVTLIELMVGMAIGLIAVVIITQVLKLAEEQKRTTSSGSDAQVNGSLALYTVQRDIQMSGYGLSSTQAVLGCAARAQRGGVNATWTLAPVVIQDGVNGAPDQLTTLTSTNMNASLPVRVTETHLASGTEFLVGNVVGIRTGDVMVAVPAIIDPANWCSVFNVTNVVTDGAGNHVQHLADATTGPWNQDPSATIFPAGGYLAGSYLLNVGQLVSRTYSIDTATYTLQESVGNTQAGLALSPPNPLYPQVVNLQALYGKDTNADGIVDTYDNVTPTTQAGWAQVRTIRIALVTRSQQFEKEPPTAADPEWDVGTSAAVPGAHACGNSQCITLTISNLPDWRNYRYKVYDSVVPLRNVLWSS